MPTRVLIVDDHERFRTAARAVLEADGLEVVGEAADGGSALTEAASLQPGVVLLDVHLPDMDGFAVAELLCAVAAPPVVILVSSRPITDLRARVGSSSAAGFLAKHDVSGAAVLALVG